MKRWIGRWIFAVGLIHTLFGLVVFSSTWRLLAGEGWLNTVNGQPEREFPFWFLTAGVLTLLLGAVVDHVEASGESWPRFIGWGLVALTVPILAIMPISGGWLLAPAVIGALVRRPSLRRENGLSTKRTPPGRP